MIALIFSLRRVRATQLLHLPRMPEKLSVRILTASVRVARRQLHAAVVLREHRDANDRQTKQK